MSETARDYSVLSQMELCAGDKPSYLKVTKRFALALTVLAALTAGCTEASSQTSLSVNFVEECQPPPQSEQTLPESDFDLTITPTPVTAGSEVDLVIELAKDAPENLTTAPEGEIITGAGAQFQCWDGSMWLDTHQLLKNGFGPDNQPAAIDLGPDVTVTIPSVGLVIEDQPYTIVIPDMPPGIYRIEDTVIVGSSGRSVYGLIEIEGD